MATSRKLAGVKIVEEFRALLCKRDRTRRHCQFQRDACRLCFRPALTACAKPLLKRVDRAPGELDPLLPTQQLQQYQHPLVRTQGREHANLFAQRATNPNFR